MSEGRTPTRAHTSNTMLLPRITGGLGLEAEGDLQPMPAIQEEEPGEGELEVFPEPREGEGDGTEAAWEPEPGEEGAKEEAGADAEETELKDLTAMEDVPEGWLLFSINLSMNIAHSLV